MTKNNDIALAKAVTDLQSIANGLDKAMRENKDMVSYLSTVEQAAREAGWAALAHYNLTNKLEVI